MHSSKWSKDGRSRRTIRRSSTLKGFREGKSIDGAKASDHMLALGTNALIPGFEDQLTGMNKGETREIKVTFPGGLQQ